MNSTARIQLEARAMGIPGFQTVMNPSCYTCKFFDKDDSLCTKWNLNLESETEAILIENTNRFLCAERRSFLEAKRTLDDPERLN